MTRKSKHRRRRRGRSGRSAVLASVAAQFVAGLASILLTIAVARTQTPDDLGVFAVTLAIQGLLIGLSRSFTADVFVFSPDSYASGTARAMLVGSATAAVIVGLAATVALLAAQVVVGLFFPSPLVGQVLIGAMLLLLPTSLQQQLRITLIAGRRHGVALVMDSVALFIVIAGAALAATLGWTVLGYLTVWSVASAIHAVGASIALRLQFDLRPGLDWLRLRWRGGSTFATDFAVTAGLAQFVILFVSAISGVAAAGALKAAQTLIMPVTLVMRGAGGPVATVLVRKVASGARREAVRICLVFSLLCCLSALSCALWLIVPDALLAKLLGESAKAAKDVVLPTALATGAMGIATGAGYFLRANGELKVATTFKVLCFPVSIVGVVCGTFVWAASGAQLGMMTGELVRSVLAWGAVRRRFRQGAQRPNFFTGEPEFLSRAGRP